MKSGAVQKYHQLYSELGFERAGLFELLKKELNPDRVLYPGSSIHITPSFFFRNVVYIDKSPETMEFFKQKEQVISLINQNKKYREETNIEFLEKDFNDLLPPGNNKYDLLISLFSGKLNETVRKYIRENGYILTSSLFSDHEALSANKNFSLHMIITCKGSKYKILKENVLLPGNKQSKLARFNNGLKYIDNEIYYIYKKSG